MYPTNFYKMKNFANPKTMFKSCSNNDEFSTEPVTSSGVKSGLRKVSAAKNQGIGSGNGTPSGSSTPNNAKSVVGGSGNGSNDSYKGSLNSGGGSGNSSANSSISQQSGSGSAVGSPSNNSTARNSSGSTDEAYATPLAPPTDSTGSDNGSLDNGSIDNATDDSKPQEHHPLNSMWTLWYLENDRSKTWEDMLHEVTSFNTVENFWSLINHIKPPSEIKLGSDYCLFKKGIRPMWEDAANKQGGRWVINLNKNSKTDLDNFWLDTMLCLIGECCEHSDELCGAVVNIRAKSNKISIWTANGNNEAAALEIGRKLRESLRMEGNYVLQYQMHKDTMVKQGSTVKSIYTM